MATTVREGGTLDLGTYGESRVTDKRLEEGEALAADQILVGRNKTRSATNQRIRRLNGVHEEMPVVGERLVCLRNNHDKGLLNGSIWTVEDVGEYGDDQMYLTVAPEEGGDAVGVDAHTQYFRGRGSELAWWERKNAEEFDFGYALTVHKAQGSQWQDVILFDESWCFRADRYRWLYTGLTRAAEKVIVARV